MNDKKTFAISNEVGNQSAPPYNFGVVVVKDKVVVSAELNQVHVQYNPALHAEISAIAAACLKLKSNHIEGATLYSDHAPCLMCFSCTSWAHIDRIVYATSAK